eukprot:1154940-Pelagomonas_calceolata.AAC.2
MDHHQQASAPPPSCHLEVLNESQKSIQLVCEYLLVLMCLCIRHASTCTGSESVSHGLLPGVNFNGEDQVYQVLEPLASGHQGQDAKDANFKLALHLPLRVLCLFHTDTFIGHTWKLVSESGELLLRYSGPSATFTVINTGGVDVQVDNSHISLDMLFPSFIPQL